MNEPVKFKDMPYERPDLEAVKAEYARLAAALSDAATLEVAEAAFLEKDQLDRHTQTAAELAMIRHVIDTRDEFYDANRHGADWEVVRRKYQAPARFAPCRSVFHRIIQSLNGELNASHLGFYPDNRNCCDDGRCLRWYYPDCIS